MNDNLKDQILTEITTFCETCGSKESCPEEECILYRIERIVVNDSKGYEDSSELFRRL